MDPAEYIGVISHKKSVEDYQLVIIIVINIIRAINFLMEIRDDMY